LARQTARRTKRARHGLPRPEKAQSLTALAGDAVRVGVARGRVRGKPPEIPGQDRILRSGDPDVDPLNAGMTGESVPGGSTPTPDQSDVDEIGRAMGVAEADSGALRTSAEILEDRDRRRDSTEGAGDERKSGSPSARPRRRAADVKTTPPRHNT
jgi:hypothetical protein